MQTLRRVAAVLVLLTLYPTLAVAQAPRAGIVTTLEGSATLRRAVLPAPVALRFRDDVLLRDTITTADRSLVRLLLGGKAIVTVRERSVLTVTETPGRSIVNLEAGKIGLAVARERLRPGESVDVRTPNAIVAVRGTVLVAEVNRATAQAPAPGTTGPPAVTNVYMLKGSAEATALTPGTGTPSGAPFVLNAFQSLTVVGGAPPTVTPFTADQIAQIIAGLQPQGVQPVEAANAGDVKAQVMNATAQALGAATGEDFLAKRSAVLVEALRLVGIPEQTITAVGDVTHGIIDGGALATCPANPSLCPPSPPPPPAVGGVTVLGSAPTFDPSTGAIRVGSISSSAIFDPNVQPFGAISNLPLLALGGNVDLPAGTTLATFGGNPPQLGAGAFAVIANAPLPLTRAELEAMVTPLPLDQQKAFAASLNILVQQLGPDDLLDVLTDVIVSGSLLDVHNGAVFAGQRFLNVTGHLTGTTADPLLRFDPSLLVSVGDFVHVNSSSVLLLAGKLIDAFASDIHVTGGGHLLSVTGDVTGISTVATSGTLMAFVSSDVFTDGNLVRLTDGGTVGGGAPGHPLVVFDDADYIGGSLLHMSSQSGQPGAELALLGPYVQATASDIAVASGPVFDIGARALVQSTAPEAFASFIDGATLTTASMLLNLDTQAAMLLAGDLLDVRRSTVTGTGSTSAFINATNSTIAAGRLMTVLASEVPATAAAATTLVLAGPLAALNATTVTTTSDLVGVFNGASLTSTTTAALVQMAGGSATMGSATAGGLLTVGGLGGPGGTGLASVTLNGPVLDAVNTALNANTGLIHVNAGGQLVVNGAGAAVATLTNTTVSTTSDLVGVLNGGVLTSTTAAALVQMAGGSATMGTTALTVSGFGGPGGTGLASLILNGPVLDAVNTPLNAAGGLIRVNAGGQLVVNGAGAAVATLTGGSHALATSPGRAIFELTGVNTAQESFFFSPLEVELLLDLGTDRSISLPGGRGLLELNGATVSAQKGVRFDTTLYAAMAPIFTLNAKSSLTTALDGIELGLHAKVTSVGPIVALNASTFTAAFGAVVNVLDGSALLVNSDLFSLANGSTLRTLNGPLVRATGSSVVNVGGALAGFFGTGGNLVSVAGGACVSTCATVAGIPVLAVNNASTAQVSISGQALRNPALGALQSAGSNSPAIIVDGPNAFVTITGP